MHNLINADVGDSYGNSGVGSLRLDRAALGSDLAGATILRAAP